MRNLPVIIVAILGLVAVMGCEKRAEKGSQTEYSKEVDGAAPVGEVAGRGDILNDQKDISRAAKAALPPPSSMPVAAKAASQPSPVEEVRKRLAGYTAAAKNGQMDAMLGFVNNGPALKPSILSIVTIAPKLVTYRSLVQDKLNMSELPQDMLEVAAMLTMAQLPGTELANVKPEQYDLAKQGDRVVVNLPGGQKMYFAQGADREWRIALAQGTEGDVATVGQLADGLAKVIDQLTPLIQTGSVTAENYAAKAKPLMDKFVEPAKAKLLQSAGAVGSTSAVAAPASAPAAP